jgi:thiamine biosynthesis lipoprotein
MGTTFEVVLAGAEAAYASQASQAVFCEIDRLERLFSRFDPSSDIGQINSLQPGQSVRVSVDVFDCLTTAFRIQDQTLGAFNINIGSFLKSDEISIPSSLKMESECLLKPVDIKQYKNGFGVQKKPDYPGRSAFRVDLDLGGIGKGFALDKILDILSDWSVDSALFHGGTSTALAVGKAPGLGEKGEGWPVGVGGNWPGLKDKKICLKDRALSGSGTEVKGQHIIDPRTGQKVSEHVAAWVSHPSAAVADALSTAFMVMDTQQVGAYCARYPETRALVLIDPERYEVYNDFLSD